MAENENMARFLKADASLRLMKLDIPTTNKQGALALPVLFASMDGSTQNPDFTLCPHCKTIVRLRKNKSQQVNLPAAPIG
jgi:hypothetical protein